MAGPEGWTDNDQGELWVFLREGLCNRLRVLFSAIGYQQLTGRRLVAHWSTSPGGHIVPFFTGRSHKPFQADVDDLFDRTETPSIRFVSRKEWRRAVRSSEFVRSDLPPDPASPERHLWLDTYDEFYSILPERPLVYAHELQPTAELTTWTRGLLDRFEGGAPAVGVHARVNAAHDATKEHSKPEWFESRVAEALAELPPSEKIFLSTDSAEWAQRLHRRFPGRLVESCEPPQYNSMRGIQKGLIDLTILASSRHIIGSYFSSFSDMAYDLQGRLSYEDSQRKLGSVPAGKPHGDDGQAPSPQPLWKLGPERASAPRDGGR